MGSGVVIRRGKDLFLETNTLLIRATYRHGLDESLASEKIPVSGEIVLVLARLANLPLVNNRPSLILCPC